MSLLGIQTRSRNERTAVSYLIKILWFFVQTFVLLAIRTARRPYDVVHVHNIPDFLVFVALLPKLAGARVILDIHDVVPELYAGKFGASKTSVLGRSLLWLERLSCAFADHVILANHLWLDTVGKRSAPASKCTVLLNYPDLELFRPRGAVRRVTNGFRFAYPGTLNHHQGLDVAIEGFAKAAPDMPGAELDIYGDGPALGMLQEQARRLGVHHRVHFRQRVPLENVPDLLARVDVGVVPKRADGFGNEAFSTKILEFMAVGVPVIVARTRIDAHYFDGDVVRFFAPGEADDLADQMRWAFASRAEIDSMADRAMSLVQEYGWQRHEASYFAIVDNVSRCDACSAAQATDTEGSRAVR